MNIENLQHIVIDALEDIKAQDIKLFDTTKLTSLFDRLTVVTATSNRQTRALASHVREKVKAAGGVVISVEGEETGEWVLVDLGDMVVHIMQAAIRSYYNLEELWGEYPLELHPVLKAPAKPAKKDSPAKKPAAKKTEAEKKTSAAKKPATAKKPIAKKPSAKKPSATGKPAAKKNGRKTTS